MGEKGERNRLQVKLPVTVKRERKRERNSSPSGRIFLLPLPKDCIWRLVPMFNGELPRKGAARGEKEREMQKMRPVRDGDKRGSFEFLPSFLFRVWLQGASRESSTRKGVAEQK